MKKIFLSIIVAAACSMGVNAQTVKASIGPGSQANRIKIYLLPDATQAASISTLQFNVGVVETGIATAPSLSVVSHGFGSATWQVSPAYNEGGYWHYNIFTASSPLTPSFTAATEFEAMEVEFTGGVPPTGTVGLVTLPDGGASANALFLCTGSIISNGLSNLYYARSGATVVNQDSYDPNFSTTGTATSFVTIPDIVLPVRFLNFTATRNNNQAILNWAVENEDANTSLYEIERSINGTEFVKAGELTALNNGRSSNAYSFTVDNLSAIRNAGVLYFRIKQIDRDGKFVYTPIRNIRLDGKGLIIGVYPNPVRGAANVTFDLAENAEVAITVIDAAGKQVLGNQLQGFKGANISRLNFNGLAAGTYTLKVQTATELKVMPVVKVN